MDEEREFDSLPVEDFKDEIIEAVRKNQIIICIGETGSGKTTKIPQFMADCIVPDECGRGRGHVAVTQPRRVAAVTVAQRVAVERGCTVGGEVC